MIHTKALTSLKTKIIILAQDKAMVRTGQFIGQSLIIHLCSGITRSRVLNGELY